MIYLLKTSDNQFLKVGFSDNVEKRIQGIMTGYPHKIEVLSIREGNRDSETYFHRKYKKYRTKGEWFLYNEELIKEFSEYKVGRLFHPVNIFEFWKQCSLKITNASTYKVAFWLITQFSKEKYFISNELLFNRYIKENNENVSRTQFISYIKDLQEAKVFYSNSRGRYYFSPYVLWRDTKEDRMEAIRFENKHSTSL